MSGQQQWAFETVPTEAPMQRAVNAAAQAWENLRYDVTADDHSACAIPNHQLIRIAITAAYPHLFQSLTRENRELKARLEDT